MSDVSLEKIVSLCKRRGFVFPSSEIYGGFAATYDFGPLGFLLKKNIELAWRAWNVGMRDDMVEIEGAIFMHPKVWEASGHVGGFADLLVEDLKTHKRYRADHLLEEAHIVENAGSLKPEQIDELIQKHNLKSPDGNPLSEAKRFNLLVKTHLGPVEDETTVAYLKGESCQNIYVDYKAVLDSMHLKLPFGIAQIGKAFRNEITVKSFLFRTREFEQMDVQYFCKPEDADKYYEEWKQNRWDFYTAFLGFASENVRWRQHDPDERAFYAKDAWDVEFKFGELGFKEIEGVHHRGSYDLDQHSKFSGQDLSYFDQETGRRFNPFIIECSGGFNRLFLAALFEFYREEEDRTVLALPAKLAPYKAAVFPLLRNKPELVAKAGEVHAELKKHFNVAWDDRGNIGKRYYSQDEIGTPFGITIDFQTLEDNTVTIRDRDTAEQKRVAITDLVSNIYQAVFNIDR
ncbi:MAG TPA: glycine--tRNA ligase [Candidatus Paceibacterota bacterium]|nr:glycine--tRNA ligase [Candidatus Paceibacterota bacterium]